MSFSLLSLPRQKLPIVFWNVDPLSLYLMLQRRWHHSYNELQGVSKIVYGKRARKIGWNFHLAQHI